MHVVVILDVRPEAGRGLPADALEQVEEQLDGNFGSLWLTPKTGDEVNCEVSVAGIGKTVAEAQQSLAARKQYAHQDT